MPDISQAEVARGAATTSNALRAMGTRGASIQQPKVIVTSIVTTERHFGPPVGTRDIMVMPMVIDMLGLIPTSRAFFADAAAAVAGGVKHGVLRIGRAAAGGPPATATGRDVGMTMPGNTTQLVDGAEMTIVRKTACLPGVFSKIGSARDVAFRGYQYFIFPMDHHDFHETGFICNPQRATVAKGEKAFTLYAPRLGDATGELPKVSPDVHNRAVVSRGHGGTP